MSKLLLLDTRNDRHHVGDTLAQVTMATGAVTFDFAYRRIAIYGESDTVSFSNEWSHDELVREMASRALTVLKRHGFQLFRNSDD